MKPAHYSPPSTKTLWTFTPIEQAFLRLFGYLDLFGGIATALTEVTDALEAAHCVYGSERFGMWADCSAQFARGVEALEACGRPELGLPSTEEETPQPGDLLSRLDDHALEADELQRVRALLGVRIATALSKGSTLPRSAIESYQSLLICRRNRSRQHEDWRIVCGHEHIDEAGLRALKLEVRASVVRDFLDDCLMALSEAIVDPGVASLLNRPGSASTSNRLAAGDEEDPGDDLYGQEADVEVFCPAGTDLATTPSEAGERSTPNQDTGNDASTLIGWRIVDGLHAPFTRKLGIAATWGATPLADFKMVCRALKHDFLVGDADTKNKVCVGYHSLQTSLPPQLVLTVPLKDTGGLYYSVEEGCYWAPYACVVGKGKERGAAASAAHQRHGRLRIAIDHDLAAYHQDQYARLPDATTLADLLGAGESTQERERFLKAYRAYLRTTGDKVHPQYAGRHARSLGPAVLEITGSDVLAMFLALDNSMVAPGMLHYTTLTARFVHAQQQRVLAELGWKPPPDLENGGCPATLGADTAIPWPDFTTGWKGVQAEAHEAQAVLAHASNLAEIALAWNKLAGTRLLSFGCVSGHRLTRIARLTGQALFGHDRYICVSDKVTSRYDAYRLLPVTLRIAELRDCLDTDLGELHAAIERVAPCLLKDAVAQGAPTKVAFFGLKLIVRNGKEHLKRTGLDLKNVEALSQAHFKRAANIGRHQLVSGLVEAGVDHWLIRALTGHHHLNAEVFGDACAIPPRHLLDQLRLALDSLLEDSAFTPLSSSKSSGQRIEFTRKVAAPPVRGDAYLHPEHGTGGRLLPPLADRHTLLSLSTTGFVRSQLLIPEEARDPCIDLLLCLLVFDGMHHEDVSEIWKRLPTALVSIAATCAAAWTREGRSNLLVVPLSPPTLAALDRVAGQPTPAWSAVTSAAGKWLKNAATDVTWPDDNLEGFLAFGAMAGRWLRLHLNPATYAASLRCVSSSALSAHSILRLAAANAPELPAGVMSMQRALQPRTVRNRTGQLRQELRAVGTVLFRYGNTKKRYGEDAARARKAKVDLAHSLQSSDEPDEVDHVADKQEAEAVLGALEGQQQGGDMPALAALLVVRKEARLILDRHKERRSWGSIATYWTEVGLALELVSPTDDMRQWTEADFEAWVELAIAAIRVDARKKGKKGDLELNGLRRFLKVGRMLGWEVPPGLIDPRNVFQQDGLRQSAAATLLRIEDFQAARPLVHQALSDWPLAQKRADLLIDLLIEVPARTGELDTAMAHCVTAASWMLCIQPAGFSVLKNSLAVRLIALSEALAGRLLDAGGEEIYGLGDFLFLERGGDDWTMLQAIRDAIYQALLLVTGDTNFRFHAARGSAACRIAFPQWEAWATALLSGMTGAQFGGMGPRGNRASVAQAIAALGHGRVPTFLSYYFSIWPWVRAHELRLTLVGEQVSVLYERQLFQTTQARRAAKSRAERAGHCFDHWDWIGKQMAVRLAAPALESGQVPPLLTPERGVDQAAPALAALTRYGLWTLAGAPSAIAGHCCGVGALLAASMDSTIAALAPSVESVWARRGQPRGQRGADTDRKLVTGEIGDAFCDHFSSLPVEALSLLGDCLSVDRRRLLLFPDSVTAQNSLIRQLANCMPKGLAKLSVRPPSGGEFSIDPALVLELDAQLVVGTAERDVGRHCLYQVAPADELENRKRIGPFTSLTRAACIAALAANQVLKGVS